MKRTALTGLLLLTLIFSFGVGTRGAQDSVPPTPAPRPEPKPKAAPAIPIAPLKRDFSHGLPIPAGEKLVYEIRYSRFPLYATVGTITFEHLGPVKVQPPAESAPAQPLIEGLNVDYAPSPGEELLHLRSTAKSKGILLAILGIGVQDRFENLVNARDFSARVSFFETKEGKRHRIQSGIFDPAEKQVKYLTTDPGNPSAPPRAKILPREDGMLSLLSAIYFVRLQKFKEGQMIVFPVSYDEENYLFEIMVGKNEKIKTDCGKVKTVRLEPKLFGPGKFFNREGEMTMWVSADQKHLPLRLVAKTSGGTISAKLLNFKKNCQIIDPEEKETGEPGKEN